MSYYVTVKDGDRTGFLAGPFRTHGAARAMIHTVALETGQVDSKAAWYEYGTAHVKVPTRRPGLLNARLGYVTGEDGYIQRRSGEVTR